MSADGDDFHALLRSVRSMGSELSSLRSSAQQLARLDQDDSVSDEKKKLFQERLTPEQRRERSRSAWARSATSRDDLKGTKFASNKRAIESVEEPLDINKAAKAVKKRSPAFSFGSRPKPLSDTGDLDVEVPAPTRYTVQVDYLSTLSRARSCVIRPPSAPAKPPQTELTEPSPPGEQGVEVIEIEEVVALGGRSFARAPRFPPSAAPAVPASAADPAGAEGLLDVARAEEALRAHTPSAVMRPAPAPRNDRSP
eukprot:gene46421-56848_t